MTETTGTTGGTEGTRAADASGTPGTPGTGETTRVGRMAGPADRFGAIEVPGARVSDWREPDSVEALAEVVEQAFRSRRSLLVAGGGTRLHWANRARPLRFGLSIRGLQGIDTFEPEEGVLHAAAGTTVRELQAAALAEGWELPLDAPGAASTLGGVLSTGVEGPRAQAFGRVRDAILGLEVVGADGILSRCGGRVVKNVTGYDLAKLYCGAFGSLGVIVGAWLRLRPRPAVQRAFRARVAAGSAMEALERAGELARAGSVRALVWSWPAVGSAGHEEASIQLELGGHETQVAQDHDRIAAELELVETSCESIDALRDARAESWEDPVVLRARVPTTRCAELVGALRALGLALEVEPGSGVVHARGSFESAAALRSLRGQAEALGGLASFERLPEPWRAELDVFGEAGRAGSLMAGIKRRFDPEGILNPGRFVAGL